MTWTPPTIGPRRPGWEKALAAELERQLALPFAWGSADCLTRVADLCLAMTGTDPMAGLRGRYRSERGALALFASLGLYGVSGALDAVFKPIPVARARRGDCALRTVPLDGRPHQTAMIVMGNGMAVGIDATDGRIVVPVLGLAAAYAVGDRAPHPTSAAMEAA